MPDSKEVYERLDKAISALEGRPKTEIPRPRGSSILAMLVTTTGPRVGQVFNLAPDLPSTIGRDPSSDIVLDDASISRQHAKIRAEPDEDGNLDYFIWDLATANGVRVNGDFVMKHRLQDGDQIQLGRTSMAYKIVSLEKSDTP